MTPMSRPASKLILGDVAPKKLNKILLLSCLWLCVREGSKCGQVVGNAVALSMTCPYSPKGAVWPEGLVHISIGSSFPAAVKNTSAGVL